MNEDISFEASNAQLTLLESYEVMFHFLTKYYEVSGSTDLTDILSAGKPLEDGLPMDTAFWDYWEKGFEIVKNKRGNDLS